MYKFLIILFALFLFSCHKTTKFSEVIETNAIDIHYNEVVGFGLNSRIIESVKDPEYHIYFMCQSGYVDLYVLQDNPADTTDSKPDILKEITNSVAGELVFQPNKGWNYTIDIFNPDSTHTWVTVNYRIDLHYNL
jgi:hypothetical protein